MRLRGAVTRSRGPGNGDSMAEYTREMDLLVRKGEFPLGSILCVNFQFCGQFSPYLRTVLLQCHHPTLSRCEVSLTAATLRLHQAFYQATPISPPFFFSQCGQGFSLPQLSSTPRNTTRSIAISVALCVLCDSTRQK